jgi:hypothetical protein
MRQGRLLFVGRQITGFALAAFFSVAIMSAQQAQAYSPALTPQAVVPRLIQFNNVLKDSQNKPITGTVPVIFAIYAGPNDNKPLWMETQDVTPSADGTYTVLLGAASEGGLPAELFVKGDARWLGIQTTEQPELARILLVSVPYALKASDADTLGGLPASAFLTAAGLKTGPAAPQASTAPMTLPTVIAPAASTTGTGTTNFVPLWTSSTNLGNSILSQSSGNLQVNGGLQLPQTGTATATAAFNSRPIDLFASSFNSSAQTPIVQHFRWQAEPVGSNTSAPSGRVNFLYAPGTGTLAETGLSISSKGILTFAPGQTLPAVTGNETVKGTVSATQLISSVATGTAPLKVTSMTQVSNLNASLLGGLSASAFQRAGAYATLGANTFAASQTVKGSLSLTGSINNALLLQGAVTHGTVTSANVIGGFGNFPNAGATGATIGGGGSRSSTGGPNIVNDDFGTVGGGENNQAGKGDGVSTFATVGGGYSNNAQGQASTVAGGYGNTASDLEATVGGGTNNTASGDNSTVAGGYGNTASSEFSIVAGGVKNTASSEFSIVAGGADNTASGNYSFAAGRLAKASASGSFVWCAYDGNECDSGAAANTFLVAVNGPIYMFDGFNGQGCSLHPGTSGWQCSSDRNLKSNIRPIESRSVLEGVVHMPISQWSMKADTARNNHIGPMAQDFYAAFGLGDNDKYIAQGDAQGVALASIQGLYQLVQEKDEQMRDIVHEKDEQIRRLRAALELLETRVARSESALGLHH